jgi:hypothetical protein
MTETPTTPADDETELTPGELPIPDVGEQDPDDPSTLPPDEGDADSGTRP